ncbi:DUF3413 domain-containing protein [Salinicola sp. JS01]|uniref:DUF3413 domain-containing protein n=1 Tax=Salinicola sp. JS01 TaxID=3050071 RepID=UPI00255BBF9B|nr:DUF3413 domain-containing protein [Salinicola sp. JS01]WIX32579.1 DUF3413 domain-containing protein [Salinicola sp. JS01]
MISTPPPARREALVNRLDWTAWFVFANVPLAWLLATGFLKRMPILDPTTAGYVTLTYIGQYAVLAWLPGLVLVALAVFLRHRWLVPVAIIVATLGQALLAVDIAVFELYRFHLSGFVLNTLIQAGRHTFDFSWIEWSIAGAALLAMLAVQAAIARGLLIKRPRPRWLVVAFSVLFGAQLGAHAWHAWADAVYDTRITSITRYVPLYHATTAKRFLEEQGWVDATRRRDDSQLAHLEAGIRADGLNYPTQPLSCRPPETRHNVLMIAVDALRGDMLDPRWMPEVSTFAERQARVYTQHYSGGNSTKAGGFSMFYGLPPTYWDAFENSRTPPVWIDRLMALGYEPQILSAATLISPAFDRTAFAGIQDIRLDPPGDEAWQRDRLITNDWLSFLEQRGAGASPFFGFLFYKSVHGYSVPSDYPRIKPYWETLNRLALDEDFDRTPYFNRYKTAVRYVDGLIGRVLDDLERRGLLDDTIVMITSDHGEEFNDNGKGYWGHGSNYSDAQLKVPMVVHWPGKPAGRIARRTSHADIPATLMQHALGCRATPPRAYTMGKSLFAPRSRDWLVAGSYMNHAVVTDDHLIVTYPTGQYEVMTTTLEPASDFQPPPDILSEVLKGLSRFYR